MSAENGPIPEDIIKRVVEYDPNADGSLEPYKPRPLTHEQRTRPLSGPDSVDGVWEVKNMPLDGATPTPSDE